MNLAELSIKRPIFITCLILLSLAIGTLSLSRLPVDLFPNITFPVITVTTTYRGAGPEEIETLVSKPLEEELSSIGGMKRIKSINKEGVSTVVAEFTLETDIKYAENQVRDRTSSARRKLPDDVDDPIIRRIDPADQPILILALSGDMTPGALFDIADLKVRPKIEQINQVGLVEVIGGRQREVQVLLDRDKLQSHEISASQVASRLQVAGQNVPAGKVDGGKSETVIRTLGEFKQISDVRNTIVNFVGNDVPVTVGDVGTVVDTVVDEKSRAFVNGRPSVLLMVYRQSGANTIQVADAVKKLTVKLNQSFEGSKEKLTFAIARDGSKPIHANVDDVKESILFGILLTIVVVFFFLGSARSTFITGLALPNSLIGAFILMAAAGFTINVMTLLALSLAVGLLIDDAIVVRENIFRHIEMGEPPIRAALNGTKEVTLAVIATTLAVIAVFGPIAFLQGVVGQFFKEFGLTICFAMAISLFDALTVAPMLSAYYAGQMHTHHDKSKKAGFVTRMLQAFDRFQTNLENGYVRVLKVTMAHPMLTIVGAVFIFVLSLGAMKFVPKTFLPPQDNGEFAVEIDLPPGTSLSAMGELAAKVDTTLRKNAEVELVTQIVGSMDGQVNKASFFVTMVPSKKRNINTANFKERIRGQLKDIAYANPKVKDVDMVGGGQRPFNLSIMGEDLKELEVVANQVMAKLKGHPALKDPDVSFRPGKPEFQVLIDLPRAERLGVSSTTVGQELRTLIDGTVPAVFREKGEEYDIRVRLQEAQRDVMKDFNVTYVPNINQKLVRLSNVAKAVPAQGPSNIDRQDRGRVVQVNADIAPNGPGLGGAIADIERMFKEEIKLPPGVRYGFEGQAENFKELMINMVVAAGLGVLFIYLVLASLYESFVTPFTIMLVLPLAACGAFFGLLVTQQSLDLFSMIGCIMLMGIATKNSILLVDYTNQQIQNGASRVDAILEAGRTRLRPILMTSFALVAGMLPVAIGLNEASKQRTSLGVAVIGGIISSTLLTLVVVPAAFSYIDRFRIWSGKLVKKNFGTSDSDKKEHTASSKKRSSQSDSELAETVGA